MSHDVATGVSTGTLLGELRALADADCGIATLIYVVFVFIMKDSETLRFRRTM